MSSLSKITLVAIDCTNPELATEALIFSAMQANFGKIVLLSDTKPFNLTQDICFVEIDKITNIEQYSRFIFNELHKYIQTDFCITIHADGFITNINNWREEFLNYDYIGAPWKKECFEENRRVGNGGFSLRSKKLLNHISFLPCGNNEDLEITQRYRDELESKGINFAPLHLAKYFSQEQVCEDLKITAETDCLGFHGKCYSEFHVRKIQQIQDSLNTKKAGLNILQT